MSKPGFVYAFVHPQAPKDCEQFVRVKIGCSGRPPWGDKHEQRGEKLAFGFELFGFCRPIDFFEPYETGDCENAEKSLKRHCREQGWAVDPAQRGRSIEVFRIPRDQNAILRNFLESNF